MRLSILLSLVACSALASSASADFITGRVVDANGVGVPGVDIDVDNQGGGGDPDIFNDGTDANGFFTTTVPNGIYDVIFHAPPPPVTTHLAQVVENVVVVGTKNMGTIVLPAGVAVSARCVRANGNPVANINVDVVNKLTGENLLLKNDTTDAFGNFSVAAPPNEINLELDTNGVLGGLLAPTRLTLAPTVDTNLGDIVIPAGFHLSGTVQNSSAVGLSALDMDVFDSATGVQLYTPRDNTDAFGNFSIVVPMGVYDVEVCPPLAQRLVAADDESVIVTGPTNVGILTCVNGFVVSGIIRNVSGTALAGVDVDVDFSGTGASVVTCADDSAANGSYAVVLPAGTLDIGFAYPAQHGTAAEDLHLNVVIGGDTVLNGVMPRPIANFTPSVVSGPAPLNVSFTDLTVGTVSSRIWDFGDSGSSTLANPSHVYFAPGTYTVTLFVSGPTGVDTEVKTALITVDGSGPGFQNRPKILHP